GQTPFDMILLWNMLDYLDRGDIGRLSRQLAELCRPGTLIYGLVSTRPQIPVTPTNFKIVDQGNLIYQYTATTQRAGPRYGQVKLLESMPGFRVKRSFLLRNGMQEYLFESL